MNAILETKIVSSYHFVPSFIEYHTHLLAIEVIQITIYTQTKIQQYRVSTTGLKRFGDSFGFNDLKNTLTNLWHTNLTRRFILN